MHEQLVEQLRRLGQVQADELRIRVQGAIIWMGMAMMVSTRLWLGGEVSEQHDSTLIEKLIARVKDCALALGGGLLFCTDGWASYPTAILKVFREKESRQATGRWRLDAWPNILIAQAIKQKAHN